MRTTTRLLPPDCVIERAGLPATHSKPLLVLLIQMSCRLGNAIENPQKTFNS
jgi:hypothetical protein